jgi:hypothetical protein
VTTDPATGALKAQYIPNTSIGGAGDHVHPNRAGYLAMGNADPLEWLVTPKSRSWSYRDLTKPAAGTSGSEKPAAKRRAARARGRETHPRRRY